MQCKLHDMLLLPPTQIKDPMLAAFTEQDEERAASAEAETERKAEEEARGKTGCHYSIHL